MTRSEMRPSSEASLANTATRATANETVRPGIEMRHPRIRTFLHRRLLTYNTPEMKTEKRGSYGHES